LAGRQGGKCSTQTMTCEQECLFDALEQWLDDGPGIEKRMRKALMDSSTVLPLCEQGGRIRCQIGWIVPFRPPKGQHGKMLGGVGREKPLGGSSCDREKCCGAKA